MRGENMDEKTISNQALKMITEAFDWTEENDDAAYRDFYNYVSGVTDLTNGLIRKLDKTEG